MFPCETCSPCVVVVLAHVPKIQIDMSASSCSASLLPDLAFEAKGEAFAVQDTSEYGPTFISQTGTVGIPSQVTIAFNPNEVIHNLRMSWNPMTSTYV